MMKKEEQREEKKDRDRDREREGEEGKRRCGFLGKSEGSLY